jgi:hypothetical protein
MERQMDKKAIINKIGIKQYVSEITIRHKSKTPFLSKTDAILMHHNVATTTIRPLARGKTMQSTM